MGHYGSNYSIFLFNMFHTPSNTIESKNKRLGSPETEEGTEQRKVKEQVANVGEMLLFI